MGSISIKSSEALQTILSRWLSKADKGTPSCIVECKLTGFCLETETMEWEVMRERTDKSEPNSEITLLGTLKTILYPLSLEGLKEVAHQAMF
jgi:mRNA capping enzyme, C-terminal domain